MKSILSMALCQSLHLLWRLTLSMPRTQAGSVPTTAADPGTMEPASFRHQMSLMNSRNWSSLIWTFILIPRSLLLPPSAWPLTAGHWLDPWQQVLLDLNVLTMLRLHCFMDLCLYRIFFTTSRTYVFNVFLPRIFITSRLHNFTDLCLYRFSPQCLYHFDSHFLGSHLSSLDVNVSSLTPDILTSVSLK